MMKQELIKITDVVPNEHAEFLEFCSADDKFYISELRDLDYEAFRRLHKKSPNYVSQIRGLVTQTLAGVTGLSQRFEQSVSGPRSLRRDRGELLITSPLGRNGGAVRLLPNTNSSCPVSKGNKNGSEIAPRCHSFWRARKRTFEDIFSISAADYPGVGLGVLEVSQRARNCFSALGCHDLATLLKYSPEELLTIRNVGWLSVFGVCTELQAYLFPNQPVKNPINPAICEPFDQHIVQAIEALLTDTDYDITTLNGDQRAFLDRLQNACSTVGKEVCLGIYLYPEKAKSVTEALSDYHTQVSVLDTARQAFEEKVQRLPREAVGRLLLPFFHAYTVGTGKRLKDLEALYSEDSVVNDMLKPLDNLVDAQQIKTVIKQLGVFLNWLDYDFESIIGKVGNGIREALIEFNPLGYDIIVLRSQGQMLSEIGWKIGLTRERVRQIIKEMYAHLARICRRQPHDFISLISAIQEKDILYASDLAESIGDDFRLILWENVKRMAAEGSKYYFYSHHFDAAVPKMDGLTTEKELMSRLDSMFKELPRLFLAKDSERLLAPDYSETNNIPHEFVLEEFKRRYSLSGEYYHSFQLTTAFVVEFILKSRFKTGFKISSPGEAARFKRYIAASFGANLSQISQRRLDIEISKIGCLCGRGKYIHPSQLVVDSKIIEEVVKYIENSPRMALSYDKVYRAMQHLLKDTQITNKYYLKGALKIHGWGFKMKTHYLTKRDGLSITDELDSFVRERGVVHRDEILSEFGYSGQTVGQLISRCTSVIKFGRGDCTHASSLKINPSDSKQIYEHLKGACSEGPVNIRLLYKDCAARFPEFLLKNGLDGHDRLLGVLEYMFRDKFVFSRAYLAKLGSKPISHKQVLMDSLERYDSISVRALVELYQQLAIQVVSALRGVAPTFLRVDKDLLVKGEHLGVTNEIIDEVADIVRDMVNQRDYLVASKVKDFSRFPAIAVPWNKYILEGIVLGCQRVNSLFICKRPAVNTNTVYVADKYQGLLFKSFIVEILSSEVARGVLTNKAQMLDWLIEEGFVKRALPRYLMEDTHFYVDSKGILTKSER